MKAKPERTVKLQLFGWVLFILCAICFLASGISNQDAWTIIGSVLFLFACIVFMLPLVAVKRPPPADTDTEKPS